MDTQKIKKDFPIFKNNPNLIYLDSAATSFKPQVVIDKLVEYYENYSANIKRGIYKISERATEEYEKSRQVIAKFINAEREEVIFTRSTTESINLIAYSLGREIVEAGDEIVTTIIEHHSNFVPWQQLAFENGADFKVADLDLQLDQIITKKTKILALTYVSNVLGTINPIKTIAKAAKEINPKIIIVVDAAQAVPHMRVDVKDLGADFIAFSGHKMLGPTGVGVLWGKKELLDKMFPFQFGGEMIEEVKIDETTFAKVPEKFEAGTPAIAEVIALGVAVNYLTEVGIENIKQHEESLQSYTVQKLTEKLDKDITIISQGTAGIISFNLNGVHPHDLAAVLDEDNICVRAGHHCAMPLHRRLDLNASARISLYLYNSHDDIDKTVMSLQKALKIFKIKS